MKALKYIAIFLLLFASTANATVLIDESFESGIGVFSQEYDGSDVVADGTAPDGSYDLRFTFPSGFPGGNAPDIVHASISGSPSEIYSRWYFKLSSGYDFHPYEQKMVFYWGNISGAGNFYISIGSWGANKMFGCVQGDGTTYRNESGPTIQPGQWYKVDVHLTAAGVFQLWLDDVLILNFTGVPLGTFTSMAFTPVYGGDSTPVPQTQYIWFDKAVVQTTAFGGGAGDTTDPYLDTFSPSDGATGVAVGTTSASFHVKDAGDGVDITTLDVGGLGCASCGSCDAGLTCSGTSADYTITRTGLSFGYDNVFSEAINASDLASPANALTQRTYNFTIQSDPNPALNITSSTLNNCVVGSPCSQTPTAEGGQTPYTWDNLSVLPAGLNVAADGTSSWGTATEAFSGTVTLRVTDALSATDNQSHTFTVTASTPTGQTTVDIPADLGAIADTFINSGAASTNYSSDTYTESYQWPLGTVANRQLYDITLALPDNVSIQNAKLYLYKESHEGGGGTDPMNLYAYRISGTTPTIATVTWNSWAGTLETYESVTAVPLTTGWNDWNVTEMTQWAYANGSHLFVAIDGKQDGAADTNRIFTSMEGTAANRPYLSVTYTQLSGPGEPSSPTPGKVKIRGIARWRSFR